MAVGPLVCCAYPFGYGPAAKLVLVAERLRELGETPVFLGSGIAHELAQRSNVFQEVISAEAGSRPARRVIASSRCVFSMMDRDHSETAISLGIPYFVADSLSWLREPIPPLFLQARRYWTQRFVSGEPGTVAGQEVGPIVRPMTRHGKGTGARLVINLGGCESPAGWDERDATYFDFLARSLLDSELLTRYRDHAILLAGARCIQHLKSRPLGTRIPCESVGHDEFLGFLANADLVVTSPGLTASLECFQLGVPTLFLPPQNWSQWRILEAFRRAGLAPSALHWADFAAGESPAMLPETQRSPAVRRIIREAASRSEAYEAMLRNLCPGSLPALHSLGKQQRMWFEMLGENGVDQIASDLVAGI